MSTLVIEHITSTPLEQKFRLKNNSFIGVLRLHLMKHATAQGNLVIKILQDSTELYSQTVAMSELNAEFTEAYGYGVFKFDIDFPLKKSGSYTEYTLQLSAPSYNSNQYYAWIKDWIPEHTNLYGTGNITDGITLQDTLKPYAFEFYEYK